jgi:hypothetical protein
LCADALFTGALDFAVFLLSFAVFVAT